MKIAVVSFTEKGFLTAKKIADGFGGSAERCRGLFEWTKNNFYENDALIFVGAVGIAVRAVAPFLERKDKDPAVVVVDEKGNFVIPILSGHIGGGNDLALKISRLIGAVPVITTATDINGAFAVDEWAKRQNCHIENAKKIKLVSSKILKGEKIGIKSCWEICGKAPENVFITDKNEDVIVSVKKENENALQLVPKIAVLGIGCKKNTEYEKIEDAFNSFLEKTSIFESSICMVASIDIKKDERGILRFCEIHNFPFKTYSAESLKTVEGDFTPSAFVEKTTGVDNVCERSASFGGGRLLEKKFKHNGVTLALALMPFLPDWRWLDE